MATVKKKAAPKRAAVTKPVVPAVEKLPEPTISLVDEPQKVVPIKPGDVKLANQMHQDWACFVPAHYTQDMCEDPKMWTFMRPKFKDFDTMRMTAEDGSFVALAIIRVSQGMDLSMQIHDWIQLQESMFANEITINDYVIRHFGLTRKFCVINLATKDVMKEGFQTQLQAMKYVQDHIKVTYKPG